MDAETIIEIRNIKDGIDELKKSNKSIVDKIDNIFDSHNKIEQRVILLEQYKDHICDRHEERFMRIEKKIESIERKPEENSKNIQVWLSIGSYLIAIVLGLIAIFK